MEEKDNRKLWLSLFWVVISVLAFSAILAKIVCLFYFVSPRKVYDIEAFEKRDTLNDSSGPSEELVLEMVAYNKQMPYGTGTSVISEEATFDLDDRMFQFNYSVLCPDGVDLEKAQVHLDGRRLTTLEEQLGNDSTGQNHSFLQLLVRDNYGIRVQQVYKPQGDTIRTEVYPWEIKELLERSEKTIEE